MPELHFFKLSPGFTLIELLIALSLIAIISVSVYPGVKRYQSTQQFQNSVSDIKNNLKRAQSSYATGTNCSTTLPTAGWSVVLGSITTNPSYGLKTYCFNTDKTISSQTSTIQPTTNLQLASSSCPINTPTIELKFDKTGFSYSCNSASFTKSTFTMTFQNKSDTTKNTTITISTGGVISQN